MALTISSMLPLGTELPKFSLPNTVDGSEFSTTSLKEMPTLIMFICNHCPYVIHYNTLIQQLETDFNNIFNLVAISSNDVSTHPDDAPSKMTVLWKDLGLSIPYLYDESQQIARQFQAECTPEFYVFDSNNLLTYRGRADDSSPNSGAPSGIDLTIAMRNTIDGQKVDIEQHPSMGCNIKWKS